MDFGIAGVAAITVIAYIVGLAARVSPLLIVAAVMEAYVTPLVLALLG